MLKFIKNIFNLNDNEISQEQQKELKRFKKCEEIKEYIKYLNLCKESNSWAKIFYPPDWVVREQQIMKTVYIGDYKIVFENCLEQGFYIYSYYIKNNYDVEIQKYQGWLGWWETTSIEDIIKEKGDYNKW